ncbi:endonuclease/exonuclease/phosphatase family protein [Sphingorhabdus sp.]|uniref:endonuclease/exonuclease/phosphatase family protein n=1 Tax=Sphingorhabdus sp. TaxID=1902408 RepID=UPI003BB13073
MPALKVATYNIRKCVGTDRRRQPERILAVLAEIDADIVALQEADKRFGMRSSAIPFHLFLENSPYVPVSFGGAVHSVGWHGNAILVRKGMQVRHAQMLPLPALEPRGAVVAEIAVNHHSLRIIGTHLDLSGLWRRRQIRTLLGFLDNAAHLVPTVIMGDFNQWSNRGALSEFAFHHHRLVHTPPSFHSRRPVARLDRIIVSHDLLVEEAGVHSSALARVASDHLPLWATLKNA